MSDDRPVRFANERLWPDERRGPYLLRVTLVDVGDRAEVVGVELWGALPPEWDVTVSGDPEAARFVTWDKEARRRWQSAVADPVPIRGQDLRLPLDRLAREVLAESARFAPMIRSGRTPVLVKPDGTSVGGKPFSQRAQRVADLAQGETRKGGRPPIYPDTHFDEVAKVYAAAMVDRLPPTQAVERRFGVSKSLAAKWVAKARDKGFLPPTSQGKPAGPRKSATGRRMEKGK